MILYPPLHFDLNEWFVILALVLMILIVCILPKRFSPVVTTFILVFNVYMGQTIDLLIGAPPYDQYDMLDRDKYEIVDGILYLFNYPLIAYVALTLYGQWKVKGLGRFFYIGAWALITMSAEWVADLAHVFTYKGWRLAYSFIVYLGVYSLNILMLHLTHYLIDRKKA